MKKEKKIAVQQNSNSTYLLFLGFFILVFTGIFLCFYINRQYPFIYADELGYLGIARYISGEYSLPIYNNAFYHFGYSFFIAPVYLFLSDPIKIYQTIVCVNVLVISSAIFFLYKILTYIVSAPKQQLVLVAFTTMLYPAFVYNSMIAWAENFLVFFYLMTLWCFLQYENTQKNYYIYIFSFCIGLLYCIHPRFLANIPFSILFFILLVVTGYLTKKQGAISIFIIVSIFLSCKIVNMHLYEAGWSYFGVKHRSTITLFKEIDFSNIFSEFAGQILYLGISSFFIIFSGVLFIVKKINFELQKSSLINKNNLFLFYVVGSTFSVFFSSVIFMSNGSRVDQFIYGRYNEVCAPIFIALGIIYFSTRKLSFKHILTITVIAFTFALILINGRGDLSEGYINFANVIGLLPMHKIFGKFHVLYIVTASCLLFVSAFIVNRVKNSHTILFFLILFTVSNVSAYPFFKRMDKISQQKHSFAKVLAEKKFPSICCDVSSFPQDYYYFQYLLKDTDIKLSRNWRDVQKNACTHLITNKTITDVSNAVMVARDKSSKIKLYDLTTANYESLPSYLNINLAQSYVKGIDEEGFYGVAGSARWSNGHVKLIIPLKKYDRINKLKIGIGAIPPQGTKIKILVNSEHIFNKFYMKGGFEIELPVRKIKNKSSFRIDIISNTFIPSRINQKRRDKRKLGVHIYMIKLI